MKSTSKCYDTVTKKYYREAEMWQRDECTSCYCGSDRKPECTQTTCPPVFCRAPLKIEQRCCLVCPDTIQQGKGNTWIVDKHLALTEKPKDLQGRKKYEFCGTDYFLLSSFAHA